MPAHFYFLPLSLSTAAMQNSRESSSGDGQSDMQYTNKSAHLESKEKLDELEKTVETLRKELARLHDDKDYEASTGSKSDDSMRNLQLAVASAQSMIFNHLESQGTSPMHMHIRLPKNRSLRGKTLSSIKDDKLMQCYDYVTARSRNLDLSKDHFSGDQFEDTDGNIVGHCCDVVHFRGVESLKQVYDALTYFMFNVEISLSETLGDATFQEDYGSPSDGACISNRRLVSSYERVASELNTTSITQYFEDINEYEHSRCAVLTTDSIDEDDLHPYNPLQFIRRGVTAAIVLTEERHPKQLQKTSPTLEEDATDEVGSDHVRGESEDDEEVVVVMRRAAFLKVYHPRFEVPDNVLLDLYDRMAQWSKEMVHVTRKIVAAHSL